MRGGAASAAGGHGSGVRQAVSAADGGYSPQAGRVVAPGGRDVAVAGSGAATAVAGGCGPNGAWRGNVAVAGGARPEARRGVAVIPRASTAESQGSARPRCAYGECGSPRAELCAMAVEWRRGRVISAKRPPARTRWMRAPSRVARYAGPSAGMWAPTPFWLRRETASMWNFEARADLDARGVQVCPDRTIGCDVGAAACGAAGRRVLCPATVGGDEARGAAREHDAALVRDDGGARARVDERDVVRRAEAGAQRAAHEPDGGVVHVGDDERDVGLRGRGRGDQRRWRQWLQGERRGGRRWSGRGRRRVVRLAAAVAAGAAAGLVLAADLAALGIVLGGCARGGAACSPGH